MEETKESEKDRERMRSNVRKIHKRSKEVRADIPTAPSARNRILQAEMRPSLMWSIPKAMRADAREGTEETHRRDANGHLVRAVPAQSSDVYVNDGEEVAQEVAESAGNKLEEQRRERTST
jgi:hypothetical protein